MPKAKLFDENSEEEVEIKTHNEYAKRYDAWREKEELHKLEQKYGNKTLNSDGSESSDSEEESDEQPEVSEEVEKQFLKTLALLKTKDPRIYDPSYKFFDEKMEKEKEKETETKKLTFDDSDDDDDDDPNIFSIEKKAEIDSGDEKTDSKGISKDDKIKEFLTGKVEHVNDEVEQDLAPLRALWSDPKLNDGEAFLRDYILNKKYLEDGDPGEAGDKIRDDDDLEEDEKMVEEQGKFERAYNFRFEEPDDEYLKRFPRTMNYIRPKDDKRSRKRAEIRARKEEEKRRKMEEIARMKALKLKEIQEKIAKIKEVTGNTDLAFKDEDIEGDFDPEEHDRRMKALFDEEYYGEADDHKPVFPDLDEELEIENWDKYIPDYQQDVDDVEEEAHCEDKDFNMDADYDPKKAKENLLEELKRNMGRKRRNRKRKSKLAELLSEEKPKFIPDVDKTYAEYMQEYFQMDCEDVIGGDLPTRFKYREVVPNDYGLTVEEILLADDKELTQWVPLKKIVKYRPDNVEKSDVKTYSQKAADVRLKKKVLPSLFKELPEEPELVVPVEANKKKKKKKKKKQRDGENKQEPEVIADANEGVAQADKSRKKNKKHKHLDNGETEIKEDATQDSHEVKKPEKIDDNIIEYEKEPTVGNDIKIYNSDEIQTQQVSKRKRKKSKNVFNIETVNEKTNPSNGTNYQDVNNEKVNNKNNLKRKSNAAPEDDSPKKKKKNKNKPTSNNVQRNNNVKNEFKKFKPNKNKQNDKTDNPLNKLSDERLKAYGLNPKKYRSFLKYKKF